MRLATGKAGDESGEMFTTSPALHRREEMMSDEAVMAFPGQVTKDQVVTTTADCKLREKEHETAPVELTNRQAVLQIIFLTPMYLLCDDKGMNNHKVPQIHFVTATQALQS